MSAQFAPAMKGLYTNKFVRNVAVVASGTAGAQAIAFVFTPIITRLYGPDAYGLQGTFVAALSILTPLCTLAFPVAMMLPGTDKEARQIGRVSVLITVAMALCLFLILVVGGTTVTRLIGLEQLGLLALLLPIALVFIGFQHVHYQWLLRQHKFSATAKGTFLHGLIRFGSEATVGFMHAAGSMLIWIVSISHGLFVLLLWSLGRRSAPLQLMKSSDINQSSFRYIVKKYRDFPVYRAPQQVLNALSQGLPVIVLGNLFGAGAAGFYVLARMAIMAPSTLLTKSITDVLYPQLTEANNNAEALYPTVLKGTLILAGLGALPFLAVVMKGPWMFALVFGAEWEMAGEYARWLSLPLFFMFVNGPSVTVLPVIGAQRAHLVLTVFSISARLAALLLGYYAFRSQVGTIAVFGVAGGVINIFLISTYLFFCSQYDNERDNRRKLLLQ